MDDLHKACRQNARLHGFHQKQGDGLAEHRCQQRNADAGFTEDNLPVFTDLAVRVQQPHKGRHGAHNEQHRAAADVDQVGGKAVRLPYQLDDKHHQRGLQNQAAKGQLLVPDQLKIAGDEHRQLAQQLTDFYALHRFSASLAAAGNRAARRLNSGLVKYFRR